MMVYHHFHIFSHRKRAITRRAITGGHPGWDSPQGHKAAAPSWHEKDMPLATGNDRGWPGISTGRIVKCRWEGHGYSEGERMWTSIYMSFGRMVLSCSGVHDGISDPIQGGLDARAHVTVIINLQYASDWCMIRIKGRMPLPCLCALRMVLDCR